MYDKPYATLKKVLQHRKHNWTKDCVRNKEWESSSGSLGCKNVCNVSFQKKSKIVEVWSIAQKQEIGWQQSDSPLLHRATVFFLKMNKQDNLPTTKCQTTLLEQLHKNISSFNVPNWNIFSLSLSLNLSITTFEEKPPRCAKNKVEFSFMSPHFEVCYPFIFSEHFNLVLNFT